MKPDTRDHAKGKLGMGLFPHVAHALNSNTERRLERPRAAKEHRPRSGFVHRFGSNRSLAGVAVGDWRKVAASFS
eukprot:1350169-Rhodomonas_salina.1